MFIDKVLIYNKLKGILKQNFNFKFFEKFRGLKIINIGRLTHQKDQMTLLKAFEKLIKFRKAKLLLIGDGNDKDNLENFIKKEN